MEILSLALPDEFNMGLKAINHHVVYLNRREIPQELSEIAVAGIERRKE